MVSADTIAGSAAGCEWLWLGGGTLNLNQAEEPL